MIATRADGLCLDTDPDRIDVDLVHRWLSTDAFWALGRSRETVARTVEHSLVFGVYDPTGGSSPAGGPASASGGLASGGLASGGLASAGEQQVAFARVVTDYATFGWLCDVYVAREARGRGIGTWLAEAVVAELAPYRLKRLMLSTLDAHEVYARAGFRPFANPERLMAVTQDNPADRAVGWSA